MPGPIGLLGGLEHYPLTESLDRQLLEEVGVCSPSVIVLPFACLPWQEVAAGELARSHWTRIGARVRVQCRQRGIPDLATLGAIRNADVIVLPGGVPHRLLGALVGTLLWEEVADRWRAGAAVTGSSAGAMALFEKRVALDPTNLLRLVPGLGLLAGYVAGPHFDRLHVRRWLALALGRVAPLGILGLDESTGLVGRPGAMKVLGAGSVTIAERDRVETYGAGAVIDIDLVNRSSVASERLLAQRDEPRARIDPELHRDARPYKPSRLGKTN
ncbi:MAG TPA: Type 1 glutamine amidotransferase-like domain-containing protein [Acidimicrobiia bacterium]|nr:Type 1 glutamine amidotransferase-like domain-containing protein [Acidimicrobiia bacterium]